jgi:replicative DNA helicase
MVSRLPSRPTPPESASLAAERCVLGALMAHEGEHIEHIAAKLSPGSFEQPRHAAAFRAILALRSRREPTAPLAVAAELERQGDAPGLDVNALMNMVDEVRDGVAGLADPDYVIGVVLEGAERRRQVVVARRLQEAIARAAPSDEVAHIIAQAAPRKVPVAANALRIRELDDVLGAPAVEWLVGGLVPEVGTTLLAAAPNTGKSLVVLDLALALVHGRTSWMGRELGQHVVGSAIYFALEGGGGLGSRMRAWKAHHPGEQRQGRLRIVTPDELDGALLGEAGAPIMRGFLRDQARELDEAGTPLRLVIIDTLAQATDGDENAAGEVRAALRAITAVAEELHVAVIVLHHVRKSANGTNASKRRVGLDDIRGSSAIGGNLDQALGLYLDEDVLVLEVVKARDGEKGGRIGLDLQSVITGGHRRDGSDEVGVVVVPRDLQGRQEAEEAAEAARVEDAKQRILEAARGQQEPLSAERLVQAARLTPRITRHLVAPLAQAGELVQVVLGRTMSRYGTPEVVQAWKQRRAGKAAIGTKRDEAPATGDAGDNPSNPAALRPDTSSALRVGRRDEVPLRSTPPGRAEDHELRPDDARDEVGRSGTKGRRRRRRKAQKQEAQA